MHKTLQGDRNSIQFLEAKMAIFQRECSITWEQYGSVHLSKSRLARAMVKTGTGQKVAKIHALDKALISGYLGQMAKDG